MQILGSVQMIAFLLIFIFSFFIKSDVDKYEAHFKCYETMHSINEKDFSMFQCKYKYIGTQPSISDL